MRFGILILQVCLTIMFAPTILNAQGAATDGETTFKSICAACHSIGRGRVVGPDLAGVTERRNHDWLLKFVKSSQSVVKSGDKTADSLFQAYNKTIMPDQPTLDDNKIKDVLAYINTASASKTAAASTGSGNQPVAVAEKANDKFFTEANIWLLTVIAVMLLVILSLARVNKNLVEQIKDFYSSDRSFFKKQN